MDLAEFNALGVGDKIENAMTNGRGTVSKVVDHGRPGGRIVSVKWGPGGGIIEFSYHTFSTAWCHWSMVEEIDPGPQL